MSGTVVTERSPCPTLGKAIPTLERHSVSVSLPAWADCVDYEEGSKRVTKAMEIGYPRFFVHRSIQKLASICEARFGAADEQCFLFPTQRVAESCRDFLARRSPPVSSRIVDFNAAADGAERDDPVSHVYPVFAPAEAYSVVKQFWQHTGDGISSRRADHLLALLSPAASPVTSEQRPVLVDRTRSLSQRGWTRNRHYSKRSSVEGIDLKPLSDTVADAEDLPQYVEERYGRNLARDFGSLAKTALRRRIAGVLQHDAPEAVPTRKLEDLTLSIEEADLRAAMRSRHEPSDRGVGELTEDDVYLYSTGMSAIFHAHQLAMRRCRDQGRTVGKSVCFGFPYTDTLKILEKWGPGCYHYGHGTDADLDKLEAMLDALPTDEPILSLFTEFPSNPLLRSPDLARLRRLADKHGFVLVVDETIGTFVNVEILPLVDIVVSSLTKVFSGDGNVMGGSLVINPASAHYSELKEAMLDEYADDLLDADALFLERNSRDFRARIARIDENTEALIDMLAARRGGALKDIYYPKLETPRHYRARLRKPTAPSEPQPGYGGLFSLTFSSSRASAAFYDALQCCKGPSLGTAFTLACPYTILAHYTELDWAAGLGVPADLVRVSVGTEEPRLIQSWFDVALEAAERVSGGRGA